MMQEVFEQLDTGNTEDYRLYRSTDLSLFANRNSSVLPHNFSIISGDMADQHHRVQLHAALMKFILSNRTEIHRRTLKTG